MNKPRLLAATMIALVLGLATGLVWLANHGPEQTASTEPAEVPGAPPLPVAVEDPKAELSPAASPEPTPQDMAVPDSPPAQSEAVIPGEAAGSQPIRDCDGCPEMIAIPAGRFQMGAPATDIDAEPEEQPRREVAIAKAFALGRYEITQWEWDACANDGICRNVPATSPMVLSDTPKTHINWQDTQAFMRWLSGKTGRIYRLPTEAEWEYAARGGTDTRYPWGDEIGVNYANCRDCGAPMGGRQTTPVGNFAPNGFGLFDMVGNVWEWTADCGGSDSGKSASKSCAERVVRGGSWANSAAAVRVTQRLSVRADIREDNIGFRMARDLP